MTWYVTNATEIPWCVLQEWRRWKWLGDLKAQLPGQVRGWYDGTEESHSRRLGYGLQRATTSLPQPRAGLQAAEVCGLVPSGQKAFRLGAIL